MEIVEIDPDDEATLTAWHAVVEAAEIHDRGDARTTWRLPEVLVAVREDQTDRVRKLYVGVEDGRVVVSGQFQGSHIDNLDHAWLLVYTHPDHRRRGHGSAMLSHVEQVAGEHGRTVLDTEASWPYSGPADGAGTEGADFLTRHGYRFGLGDVHRMLDLPVAADLLDRLAEDAAPHHAGYTLRSWVGPVPEEIVESFAGLVALLVVEAPMGEMEREPESADVGALRRGEDLHRKQGRTVYSSAALDASGAVVAYSNLGETAHDPANLYQWGTLVRRADRGHRLGMAVKVATLRLLQSAGGGARRLHTWNAEVNAHMIGINEALGFRPVERSGEFQKRTSPV
jgi:GNAT superfamily N-acetyltransferase